MPVIGLLVPGTSADVAVRIFSETLHHLGYVDGQNIRLEVRSAGEDLARLPELAAGLVREPVDIIAPWATPAVLAAKHATSEIPIVMLAVGDPVASGIVPSLAHPGGNITGTAAFGAELSAKLIDFLIEAVPDLHRIAAFLNAADPFYHQQKVQIDAVAKTHNIEVVPLLVRAGPELDAALTALDDKMAQAVFVQPTLPMKPIINRVVAARLPSFSSANSFTPAGGLMSYAPKPGALFGRAAVMVDKILKGAKPSDLPIERPTEFQFMINLKTAKAIGLTIPQSLLARADEVIE
jgi:putative ABC transport system substrate-binding protein